MKKEPKKLKLNKIIIAKLSGHLQVEPKKAPTVGDWTCGLTVRTCASFEFTC
ncbi:hypothetical protein L3C95_30415 [Chitinophaga filiformis]|uniref:hypothetical protein n=1 Tax=Chitinophaga filiformis TaxID=104663 RepID=UPI001F2453FC|nr:hypothetical protein [Chitinophaga filiformis]MCF6407247.1 hypothetical protein [Chitinophaga filiformis]